MVGFVDSFGFFSVDDGKVKLLSLLLLLLEDCTDGGIDDTSLLIEEGTSVPAGEGTFETAPIVGEVEAKRSIEVGGIVT